MNFAAFQFELVAKDELRLPLYKGSAFRGLFGHALKRTVCVTRTSACDGCLLRDNCAYAYIFETFNGRNERVARPFVLEPPLVERRIFPPGDVLKVNLILFGKAIDYLPYLVHTFREMGKRGLGANHGTFWLQRVTKDGQTIYDFREQKVKMDFRAHDLFKFPTENSKRVAVRFITPTSLKVKGRITKDIDFSVLIKAIIRRLKALSAYHNGQSDFLLDVNFDQISTIKIKSKTIEPYNWQRYSSRQGQKIAFTGFIGEVVFEGDLGLYMKLIRMGEIIHIGRGTVYGMGKYVVG